MRGPYARNIRDLLIDINTRQRVISLIYIHFMKCEHLFF